MDLYTDKINAPMLALNQDNPIAGFLPKLSAINEKIKKPTNDPAYVIALSVSAMPSLSQKSY
jgi:hypothetical protein